MIISRKSSYSISAMLCLADQPAGQVVPIESISQATGIPTEYLRKLFAQLAQARLISSRRGRRGGFHLSRAAEAITVLEVVEAVSGPVAEDELAAGAALRFHTEACAQRFRAWERGLHEVLLERMRQTVLTDLMN